MPLYLNVGRRRCKAGLPEDGGDWYYKINGTRVSVKEMGGWNIQHNYQGTNMGCLV